MREIITLQLGQYANFVGAHFWNAQEEYFNYDDADTKPTALEHDVLYRAGRTSKGVETYTPRVLVYDLKGGFGAMPKYNKLFSDGAVPQSSVANQWDQNVTRVTSEKFKKNAYQQQLDRMEEDDTVTEMDHDAISQLDESVETWSDFNRIYYHPRSMNQITTHHYEDSIKPFEAYNVGRQSYTDNEKETEMFEDNFRAFAEECDQLQGFQVFCDIDNAFGGFTEGLLDDVRDEYPKASILTYALSDRTPSSATARQKQSLNHALSTVRLADLSSLYIPLFSPTQAQLSSTAWSRYLHPNCQLHYHTSAIISAAIETASLPYRLKKNAISLTDITTHLQWSNASRLACLSAVMPLPIYQRGADATLDLLKSDPLSMLNFTAKSTTNGENYGEVVVARGLPSFFEKSECQDHIFSLFRDENSPLHQRYCVDSAYPLPDSYPRFFDSLVGPDGLLKTSDDTARTDPPRSVPMLTQLFTGPALHGTLNNQLVALKGLPFKNFIEYTDGDYGLSQEDYLETREQLENMVDSYEVDTE